MKLQSLFWAAGLAVAFAAPHVSSAQDGVPQPDELFKRLDKNGDGKVTKDEVPEDQRRFFDRSIRVGDKDDDGALTKDEFLQASKPPEAGNIPLTPGGGPGGDRRDMQQRFDRMITQRFETLDKDKDGRLTIDEVPESDRSGLKGLFDRLSKTALTLDEYRRLIGADNGRTVGGPNSMFARLDKNNDGKITKDEIPAENFPERLAEELKRSDHGITRDEFMEILRRDYPQFAAPGPPREGMDGRRAMSPIVRLLDTDNDGRLSKAELAKAVDKFAELDENGDGQLDPRELMGPPPGGFFGGPGNPDMRRPGSDARPRANNAAGPFFAQLDRNSDGKLSKEEAPERMKEVFDRLDKDEDGFLTAEEMRAAAERFPGRPGANRPEGDNPRPRRPAAEEKKAE